MAKIDKYFLGESNSVTGYNHLDKKTNVNNHIKYMLNRSVNMFKYHNLPDTIPAKELELLLQCHGHAVICKINDSLYAVKAGLGGECDVYGNPTQAIVTVPYLNYNATLSIDTDCIVMNNDIMQIGLLPMYQKYCTLMNENEITMLLVTVNKRIQNFISANDDSTVQSARKFLQNVFDGKMGVIAEQRLFDSLKIAHTGSQTGMSLTELFEFEQYLKASLFNEIGLSANYNMKRERLTKSEVECNTDNLYPLPDEMLSSRREAIDKINNMFGTDILVEFSSSWDYRVLGGVGICNVEDEIGSPEEAINEADEAIIKADDETSDEAINEADEAKDETSTPIQGSADEADNEACDEADNEACDEANEAGNETNEVTTNEETDSENNNKDSYSEEKPENRSITEKKPENDEKGQEIEENEQKKDKK